MKVLNVGCGGVLLKTQTKVYTGWEEIRVDAFKSESVDVVSDITNLKEFEDESFDSVWASHIVEHNHWHDLPKVFGSIMRVLKKDGFAIISTPDIGSIAHLIPDKLLEPLYISQVGPICPIDMIYGLRSEVEEFPGMAHKVCFTAKSLTNILGELGIKAYILAGRNYELVAFLYKDKVPTDVMKNYGLIVKEA